MSDMFWVALKLSVPKIGFNIIISLNVKNVDAFKFDGVAESDYTEITWILHAFVLFSKILSNPLFLSFEYNLIGIPQVSFR